jgi:hypothetical protein
MAELLYQGLCLLVLFYQIDDVLHDYPEEEKHVSVYINKYSYAIKSMGFGSASFLLD